MSIGFIVHWFRGIARDLIASVWLGLGLLWIGRRVVGGGVGWWFGSLPIVRWSPVCGGGVGAFIERPGPLYLRWVGRNREAAVVGHGYDAAIPGMGG